MTTEEIALSGRTDAAARDLDRMNAENAVADLQGRGRPHGERALLRQYWAIQACAQEQADMAHWLHS